MQKKSGKSFLEMSLCIVVGTKPNLVLPADTVNEKTCKQLLEEISLPDSILIYHNSFYSEVCPLDSIPAKEHPDLILEDKIEDYPPPPIYLFTAPSSDSHFFWIEVEIFTQLKDAIPPMRVSIDMRHINSLTMEDILLACRTAFGYDFTDPKFTINDEEVPRTDPAQPILEKCKNSHLQLHMTVGDQGKKKIGARGHVTAEIISSEEAYNNDLQVIEDYWEPQFRQCPAFTEAEAHKLFRDIKQIHSVHKDLLAELKQIKPGFMAEMSYVYLKHLDNFTKATAFVSAFKSLDDMMKEKRKTRSIDKQIEQIEQNLPLHNGRNFMSYYITPVQRYPRYPLLFRELDKCTPSFHPEKQYIQYTFQRLTEVNKKIDSISHRVLQIQLMNNVQAAMPPDYLVIGHNREIIEQLNVRIVSKKSGPGTLYLFNDLILLVTAKKKINFEIEPMNFSFANGKPAVNSIYILLKNEFFQIDFADLSEKATFMEAYHALMDEKFKAINLKSPYVKWLDVDLTENVPTRVSHEGCVAMGSVYFFGGTNESCSPTSTFIKYNISESTWSSEEPKVPYRELHTVSAIRDNIYVCFGMNTRNQKPLNDIWVYNISSKSWTEVKPTCVNVKSIKPRYGHTCVVYDGKLYFFGGYGGKPSGKESKIYNILGVYDPVQNEYSEIADLPNMPKARYGHCAALVGKNNNKMVIIGGRTDSNFYTDTYVLSFKKKAWANMQAVNVNQRAYHKCAVVGGRYLFVTGGINNSQVPETIAIDTYSWTNVQFQQFGNIPPHLSKHTMIALDQNKIMIFGGTDRLNHRSFPSSWILDTTDSLHQFNVAAPQVIQRYWTYSEQGQDPMPPQQLPRVGPQHHPSMVQVLPTQLPPQHPASQQQQNAQQPQAHFQEQKPQTPPPMSQPVQQQRPVQTPQEIPQPASNPQIPRRQSMPEHPEKVPVVITPKSPGHPKQQPQQQPYPQQPYPQQPYPQQQYPPQAYPQQPYPQQQYPQQQYPQQPYPQQPYPQQPYPQQPYPQQPYPQQQYPPQAYPQQPYPQQQVPQQPPQQAQQPQPQPMGPMFPSASALSNARSNLKKSATQQSAGNAPKKPAQSEQQVKPVDSFSATGEKFNMSTVQKQLCIDVSRMNPFEMNATKHKCQRLWQNSYDNNKLEQTVKKMEALISGNFDPPADTNFLLKVFDDNSRHTKLTRLSSNAKLEEVIEKANNILGRTDAILTIAVGIGDQRPLEEENLRDAMRNVYKGEMRCLTINAL